MRVKHDLKECIVVPMRKSESVEVKLNESRGHPQDYTMEGEKPLLLG